MAKNHPLLAISLAEEMANSAIEEGLNRGWPILILPNAKVDGKSLLTFCKSAFANQTKGISEELISCFASKSNQEDKRITEEVQQFLIESAKKATKTQTIEFLRSIGCKSPDPLKWLIPVFENLPLEQYKGSIVWAILNALVPYYAHADCLLTAKVDKVLRLLVEVQIDKESRFEDQWRRLCERFPLETYQFFVARIEYASKTKKDSSFSRIPFVPSYSLDLDLGALKEDKQYHDILDFLWNKVVNRRDPEVSNWIRLFKIVAIKDADNWLHLLIQAIRESENEEKLLHFTKIIHFKGSIVIFKEPALAKAFLEKALEMGGKELLEKLKYELWIVSGPWGRSYTNGKLDKEYDYLEAEALKAG